MANVYRIHFKLQQDSPDGPQPIVFDQTVIDDVRQGLIDLQAYIIQWNALVKSKLDSIKQDAFPDVTDVSPFNPVLVCSIVQDDTFIDYSQKISDFIQSVIDPLNQSIESGLY